MRVRVPPPALVIHLRIAALLRCGVDLQDMRRSGVGARSRCGRRAATTAPMVPTSPPVTDTASRAGDTRPVTASPSTTSAIVPGAVPRTVPSRYGVNRTPDSPAA